uniref:hypothetical protein n=1 Tax=Klebsiella pneumoniae TaxID=573 RepID=UPI003D36EA14
SFLLCLLLSHQNAFYRQLARRAISAWRRSPVLAPFYHEVGVLFHTGTSADGPAARAYVEEAVAKAREPSHEDVPHLGKMLPSPAYLVEQSNPDAVRECFPSVLRGRVGKLADDIENGTTHAYFNSRAGWGEAD